MQAGRELAGITEQTAKSPVHSILGKLGMLGQTQAAVYAARIGGVTRPAALIRRPRRSSATSSGIGRLSHTQI
jgi:hypothetical protein